jgi:putative transcriptional regulator
MSVKRPLVMNQPQIGQLVRELRLSIGLTQEQFAAHLGVTCGSINRWENGRSEPLPLARQQIWQCIEQMGVVSQRLFSKKRTGLVRIALSNNSKDFVDEL